MIQNLTAMGRKLVAIVDPHIKRDGGYFLHQDAESMGLYVKNKDGNVYEGQLFSKCLLACFSLPLFSLELKFLNPLLQGGAGLAQSVILISSTLQFVSITQTATCWEIIMALH